MDRRLFPLAELAAVAGILAGGYTIVASGKAAVLAADSGKERSETWSEAQASREIAKVAAADAKAAAADPAVPALAGNGAGNSKLAASRAAAIATTRPPVPLVLNSRPPAPGGSKAASPALAPPVNAPPVDAPQVDASADSSNPDRTGQTDSKVSSAAAAKAMIEADGYKNVRSVTKAPDGSWRGVGMRGTVEVALSVDSDGNVRTQ
jgi:hypothetical protein